MKINLNAICVLVMSITFVSAFGQCTKKTDDVTKTVTVETKREKLGGTGIKGFQTPMFIEASMHLLDNTYILYLFPEFIDIKTIDKGSVVYIKFDDESVIQLNNNSTDISNPSSGALFSQNTTVWTNTVQLLLNDSDLSALRTKKVVKIRVAYNDYVIKKPEILSQWISCIDKTK